MFKLILPNPNPHLLNQQSPSMGRRSSARPGISFKQRLSGLFGRTRTPSYPAASK